MKTRLKYYVPKSEFTYDGDEVCDAITLTVYLKKPNEDCYELDVELTDIYEVQNENK